MKINKDSFWFVFATCLCLNPLVYFIAIAAVISSLMAPNGWRFSVAAVAAYALSYVIWEGYWGSDLADRLSEKRKKYCRTMDEWYRSNFYHYLIVFNAIWVIVTTIIAVVVALQ